MKKIIIALDGPAGSGKTTTAKLVAGNLGFLYIDTGAMYRAVTLACIREKIEIDEINICNLMLRTSIDLKNSPGGQRTLLNGEDVSDEIRLPAVTGLVSPVSAVACVRTKLVDMQRALGNRGDVILDGRDIGTVVFPDADLKVFLIASADARAKRRALELSLKGIESSVDVIRQQIADRDNYDSSRSNSPLRKADDAIELDTSDLSIEQQVDIIVKLARERMS